MVIKYNGVPRDCVEGMECLALLSSKKARAHLAECKEPDKVQDGEVTVRLGRRFHVPLAKLFDESLGAFIWCPAVDLCDDEEEAVTELIEKLELLLSEYSVEYAVPGEERLPFVY